MVKIFLSYRREDSTGVVGRISDRLRVPFGPDSVFVDVDSVPLGVDFQEYIESVLSHCDVFLAVIGPDWAGQINTGRRIDDPRDWVRIEVEAALKRGLPVIPVLIDHTRVPSEADLPPSLVPLVRRNAVRVDQGLDFHVHVDRLIRGIELLFQGAKVATVWSLLRGALPKRRWFYLAALLLLALLGIILTLKLIATTDGDAPTSGGDAPPVSQPPQPTRYLTNFIGMRLVLIEPDSFQMGSTKYQIDQLMRLIPDSKRKRFKDEQPRHPVEITRPFFLGIHEVTVGQFRRFVEESGHQTEAEKDGQGSHVWNETKWTWELDPGKNWRNPGFSQTDDYPVVCVSHNDAMAFCQWLSQKEGRTYRLPTEAEWEFACRAGTMMLYPNGDDPERLVVIANVADATLKRKFPNSICIEGDDRFLYTAPVGSFAPNPWGLYDMIGNVWEWCADWYDGRCYSSSSPADPPGAPKDYRVFRGGGWYDDAVDCRPARRYGLAPEYRDYILGFRVAADQK